MIVCMINQEITSKNLDLFVGSDDLKTRLIQELTNSSHQTYLLVGPDNVGKGFLSKLIAANLMSIEWKGKLTHPDLVNFKDILDKNSSSTGEKQWKQSVDELIHFIHLTPLQSLVKVAIIQNIDMFSPQALNALLKTLEEPPEKSIIIMTAVDKDNLLPTILSRVQILRLNFLPDQEIQEWLSQKTLNYVDELTVVSNGCIGLAMQLIKDQDLRERILNSIKDFQFIMDKDLFKSLQVVNQKDREKTLYMVDLWLNLIRRIWLDQLNHQKLPKSMQNFTQKYSNKELVLFLCKLQEVKLSIIKNANARIAMEDVIVSSLT